MGLSERRAIKTFQTESYPTRLQELQECAGFDLTIDVEWDKLAEDGMGHLYEEAWTKVYFEPLREALASICVDDMGREALSEGLTRVRITNEAGNSSATSCFHFEGGTLTIDHKPTTNIDYGSERTQHLVQLLENAL